MTSKVLSKLMLAGVLALSTLLTVAPQTAEAGPVRVNFTPPFGAPFPNLDWGGVVEISDGGCTLTGPAVSNSLSGCNGGFTFLSATLTLKSLPLTPAPAFTQSIDLLTSSSLITSVNRSGPNPEDFFGAEATPFLPVQGNFPQSLYNGEQAWFSLVLLGQRTVLGIPRPDIRLYWFANDPGSYFSSSNIYRQCGAGSVVNVGDFGACGVSDSLNFPAAVTVTAVPEPSTYALMLAGLGVMGFVARRRAARA